MAIQGYGNASTGFMLVALLCMVSAGMAETVVGDNDGWKVPTVADFYKNWSRAHPVFVGDSLEFKYDGKVDSVLRVSHAAFKACDTSTPIKTYPSAKGSTTVLLKHAITFYFISGNASDCKQGQAVEVKVQEKPTGTGDTALPPSPTEDGTTPPPTPPPSTS